MSKNRIVFLVGIYLVLFPFFGFPTSLENFLSVIFGLILVWLSLSISLKHRTSRKPSRRLAKVAPVASPKVTETASEIGVETKQVITNDGAPNSIVEQENNQA